jgi:hypothetical protein
MTIDPYQVLPKGSKLSDWIKHDGGPRPVSPETIVHVDVPNIKFVPCSARTFDWSKVEQYRIVDFPSNPDSPNDHYRQGDIECIDAIRAALTDEEWRGFCKGNVLKYTWREKHKGGDGSLLKAQDYLRWAVAGKAEGKR